MSQSTLLMTGASALKLDDDIALLQALGALINGWGELKPRLTDIASIEALLAKLVTDATSQEVAQAFAAVGLAHEHASLVAFLGKVTDAAGKIQPKYQALLKPLNSFAIDAADAKVGWTVATSTRPVIKTDQYGLNLGLEAKAGFDAGATWPDAVPATKLLQLSASGKVEAGASATVPYAFGALQAEAAASAMVGLDYYFAAPGGALYAAAVASRLGHLPDPFSLAAVWQGFQWQDQGLAGIVYAFGGSANASFKVTFADALALGAGTAADVGLTVGVSATLESRYKLVLKRDKAADGGLAIRAVMKREKTDARSFNAKLSLDVDVAALVRPVAEAVKRAVGKWDDALADIQPYLTPGTGLRDLLSAELTGQVEALIRNENLRDAVLSDLKGALGIGAVDDSAVAGWLTGQIIGAIDRGSALVDGDIDKAVGKIMGEITRASPVLAEQVPTDDLRALVKAQVQKLDDKLRETVQGLLSKPAGALKAALAKAGVEVNGAVATLDDALKGVRELLKRCDKLFHDILAKAEEAAKSKVTARLYREETRVQGSVVEVDGLFTATDPKTDRIFDALVHGALENLVRVIDGSDTAPGFSLNAEASSLTRFSRFGSEEGVEIAFINILLKAATLISGEATVVVDGRGDIHVDAEAALKKTVWTPLNNRDVSFVDTYGLVQAAKMSQDPARNGAPSLDLGIGAVFSDKTMAWKDIEAFIAGLDDAHLLAADARVQAKAVFDDWSGGAGKIAGAVSANLRLKGPTAEALMQLSARTSAGLDYAARQTIIKTAYAAAVAHGAIDGKRFDSGALLAAENFKPPRSPLARADIVLQFWDRIGPLYQPRFDGPAATSHVPTDRFSSEGGVQYKYFVDQGFRLRRLVDLIDIMGAIYQSQASGGGTAGGWTEQVYADKQQAMVTDSKYWLTVLPDIASIFSGKIAPRTVAFMRAVADLSGRGPGASGGVTLTLTCQSEDGGPKIASFG